MSSFTHFNDQGRAQMVDISDKKETVRTATVHSHIKSTEEIIRLIQTGGVTKGDVLAVAQVAGIMAAKRTAELIPMCHPLPLTGINIAFSYLSDTEIQIQSTVKTTGKTGVEMESLTAATVAALTIYDMCKALDKNIVIGETYLVSKTGGKSGNYSRD